MAIKTRKEIRQHIATLLQTALTGSGNPAQQVYNHFRSAFDESPVVCVVSAQIDQSALAFATDEAFYGYEILVFVDRDPDANYTEEDAENKLDEIAQSLFSWIETNARLASYWQHLRRNGNSQITPGTVGGRPVWMEVHPIAVQVWPNA